MVWCVRGYVSILPRHIITVTSNDHHGVFIYRSMECLFNSLLRLTAKKHQRSALLSLCEGNPLVTGGFPSKRDNDVENASIWWGHNVCLGHFTGVGQTCDLTNPLKIHNTSKTTQSITKPCAYNVGHTVIVCSNNGFINTFSRVMNPNVNLRANY